MELVHERDLAITDDDGTAYDCLRVYAYRQPGGTWAGMLEFLRADGAPPVRSERETTQSTAEAVAYWATGLEPLYFEGALARALRKPADVISTPAPAVSAPGRWVARVEVDTADPQLPLRVMATRTLVRGFHRRLHAGSIFYDGSSREGRYAFLVQFGTDNAAAIVANVLWTEVRNASRVSVEGLVIEKTPTAIKDALLAATARRVAG